MKVLLLKDVYKLGRAGDIKKVANGYGRNYLLPQGMAVLATGSALQKVNVIREEAQKERAILNKEMESVAAQLSGLVLYFPSRVGETGKLYGSITTHMIADAINAKVGGEIVSHRIIETQPIRELGTFNIGIRLTMDMVPEVKVEVHREGETPASLLAAQVAAKAEAEALAAAQSVVETPAETPEAE